jgi:beta-N-acetylhexosaminidase
MNSSPPAAEFSPLGELFMAGLPGPALDSSTLDLIGRYGVNNFIYFKRNVESPEQLKKLSADLRNACAASGLAPPLIAIDQEGGTVARLGPPFTQFADARVLAESPEPEKALQDYARVCGAELMGIGVNYNLAPVLDVCPAGKDLFMERRSLGGDPETVGRFGRLVIQELQAHGIAACAKHFPGLGGAVVDPHERLPAVDVKADVIRRRDLLPFREAIAAGVASIMTSHTLYRALDPEEPATLSQIILTGLLRQELGYEGVVITDDLEMGAIERQGEAADAAVQAFGAGADLLLICESHEKVVAALEKTAAAIARKPVLAARLNESLLRVRALRKRFASG